MKCQPAKRALFSSGSEAALDGQSKSTALSSALQLGLSSDGPRPSSCFNPVERAPIKFDLASTEDQQTHVANNLTFSPICSSVESAPSREAAHTRGLYSPSNLSEACSPTTGVLTTPRTTPSVVILSSTVHKSDHTTSKLTEGQNSIEGLVVLTSEKEKKGGNASNRTSTEEAKKTNVIVKIEWPSQTKQRYLPGYLHQLGKMLCRGTYKQISCAAWRHPELRQNILKCMAKELDKECSGLCSIKNPSCLGKTEKEQLLNFSF